MVFSNGVAVGGPPARSAVARGPRPVSGAGGGIGLPVTLRGCREGAPTRFMHAGDTHSIDGAPLPARIQLLMNFSIFDAPAWSATMDRFRLRDIREAVSAGKLDLNDPVVKKMVAQLVAAVRARDTA